MISRIINMRFKCCGLHFDAAIDCDWTLHCYEFESHDRQKETPIELYCFDKPEWDIRMIYYHEAGRSCVNAQQNTRTEYLNTLCDMEFIKKETRKWVREMNRKK